MGFWDSYNKETVRQGYTSHSEFQSGFENETSPQDSIQGDDSTCYDEFGSETADDCYEIEAVQAINAGDFETALGKYLELLDHGNLRMLLKIADLLAIVAVYDKYNRPYRIGSDRDRDYSLECALTFYIASLIIPECESEAEDHLNILQRQCSEEYDFQIMVQRVSDRISESIRKDPIGFVRAVISQYQTTRS